MLIDIFFFLLTIIITFITLILAAIGWFVPPAFHDILLVAFSFLAYLQGYFPFYPDPTIENTFGGLARTIGIMTIAGWTITFFVAQYTIRILSKWMPMPHFIRFGVGEDLNLDGPPLDLRPADLGAGRVVDLRRGPRKAKRWLRDIH